MFCTDVPESVFMIFSDYVPALLYYSHIPTALVALFLGSLVFLKNRKSLAGKLLFVVAVLFSFWSLLDLILWTGRDSRWVMFFWSLINLIEILVSLFTLYFSYVFLKKKDIRTRWKLFYSLPVLAFAYFVPTKYNLPGFNTTTCEAIQGQLINYFYLIEAFFLISLLIFLAKEIINSPKERRHLVILFSLGVILFSVSFTGANIMASLTGHWEILQYGLFGMPIFMAFLTFLIVRYEALNIKMLKAQALVIGLSALVGSEIFFVRSFHNRVLVAITFLLMIFFGRGLIRSVKDEIRRKEELEIMTEKLKKANVKLREVDRAKSEFLSIASHQLRTPITAIKGFLSLVLEGSYGQISKEVKQILNKVYLSNERLVKLIEDLLNISRIESGRMQFSFELNDLEKLVQEIADSFSLAVNEKGLKLSYISPKKKIKNFLFDRNKIQEVVSNLIDNSIKYTAQGEIEVGIVDKRRTVEVYVKDNGIGIKKGEEEYIFEKFQRGTDAGKVQTEGVGLGLYVCKKMLKAHDGKIWAKSPGKGKGSTFVIELPKRKG